MQITHKLPHDTQIRAERKNEKRGEKTKQKQEEIRWPRTCQILKMNPPLFMEGCKQGPSLLLQEPLNCDAWTKDRLSGNVRTEVVRFPVLCSHLGWNVSALLAFPVVSRRDTWCVHNLSIYLVWCSVSKGIKSSMQYLISRSSCWVSRVL